MWSSTTVWSIPALVARAPAGAELIYVGKRSALHTVPQDGINELILEHARTGRLVVRLKGGDPFIFGRGGEEAAYLRAAGVACEIVPGISAGYGAPAYAGIPVTHRGHRLARDLRHRPRGPDQGRGAHRLGQAGVRRRHLGHLHGGQEPAPGGRAARQTRALGRHARRADPLRHPAQAAHRRGHAGRHRREGGRREAAATGHHHRGRGRQPARAAALVRRPAALRQAGRGHAAAGAGRGADAGAARPGGRGGAPSRPSASSPCPVRPRSTPCCGRCTSTT